MSKDDNILIKEALEKKVKEATEETNINQNYLVQITTELSVLSKSLSEYELIELTQNKTLTEIDDKIKKKKKKV